MKRLGAGIALWFLGHFIFCGSTLAQEVVGGEKAKRFFERFRNEDPDKLAISFDSLRREGEIDEKAWRFSPPDTTPIFHVKEHRAGLLSVGADERGRRYIQQDTTGIDITGLKGWSLGLWMLPTNSQDFEHSELTPSCLYANRISYLLRMPDEIVKPDGTIIDIRKNPRAYMDEVGFQRGTYNQHDGDWWFDYDKEDSGWHFYYWPAWMAQGANTVKVEPLGDDPRFGPNFLRVTFNTQHSTIRSGGFHSRGQFGATDPELASFEGDRLTTLRTETRHYLDAGGLSEIRQTDPTESTITPFDDGRKMWQVYGASYWYEDDQVDIVGFTPEKPQGTSLVQELVSLEDPQILDFPVEIRNTSDAPSEYVASVAMLEHKTPLFDLNGNNALGVSLHPDSNRNGVLDGAESTQTVGTQRVRVPGKSSGRFILRLDLSKLTPGPTALLEQHTLANKTPPKVIDLNLTVNTADPKDSMSLKGASAHFIVGLTNTKAEREQIEKRNLFLTGASTIRFKPFNRAPEAKVRAYKVTGRTVTPLPLGSDVTVGETIRLESYGSPGDGDAKQVGHRFYFPDGLSSKRKETDGPEFVDFTPWQAGENHFLLHVANGFSRAFEELSVNVKQAPNVPPIATIDHPQEGSNYPAKQTIFFGSHVGASLTRDPDGGREGTQRGITHFEWNFGDGTPVSQEQFAEHVYTNAGTYRVKLTVTDDEGSRASIERTLTIRQENRPPQVRLEAVSSESFMEFGLVEVTAASTTDPDQSETNDENLKYFWSVQGPNGITEEELTNFTEKSPRYLFVAITPGTYTVKLLVRDTWGAKSSADVSFVVKPWDGIFRINMFSNTALAGNSYSNNDLDPQIPKGWSIAYPGQRSAPIGRFGDAIINAGVGGSKAPIRNVDLVDMPANASQSELGLFSSSIETLYGTTLYTLQNLPAGTYEVTAYMFDQDYKAPGTEYGVRFQVSEPNKEPIQIGELKTTLPANPKASDFIVRGRIIVPALTAKGYVSITGRTPDPAPKNRTPETVLDPMRSALSAIELKRVDGEPPPISIPAAPSNLRITNN